MREMAGAGILVAKQAHIKAVTHSLAATFKRRDWKTFWALLTRTAPEHPDFVDLASVGLPEEEGAKFQEARVLEALLDLMRGDNQEEVVRDFLDGRAGFLVPAPASGGPAPRDVCDSGRAVGPCRSCLARGSDRWGPVPLPPPPVPGHRRGPASRRAYRENCDARALGGRGQGPVHSGRGGNNCDARALG